MYLYSNGRGIKRVAEKGAEIPLGDKNRLKDCGWAGRLETGNGTTRLVKGQTANTPTRPRSRRALPFHDRACPKPSELAEKATEEKGRIILGVNYSKCDSYPWYQGKIGSDWGLAYSILKEGRVGRFPHKAGEFLGARSKKRQFMGKKLATFPT